MSAPTVKELETVIGWLEKHADNDKTSTLREFLSTAKADLAHAQAEEKHEFDFAKAYFEHFPSGRPWDLGLRPKWADLSEVDRRYQITRAKPLMAAIEKAGWTKPRAKARTWDDLKDVPTNIIVVDREGDRWEHRNGTWGLGTGGNWGTTGFLNAADRFGPFREYLG